MSKRARYNLLIIDEWLRKSLTERDQLFFRDRLETYRSTLNHLLFPVRTSGLVRTFWYFHTVQEHPEPHILRSLQAQLWPNEHEGSLLFVKFRI